MATSTTMQFTSSRRTFLAALGLGASASVLASCGKDESDKNKGGSGGQTKLTFLYMGDASQQKQWKELFQEFERTHKNIKLEAQGIAADSNWAQFFNQASSRMAGGQPPDMIQVATEGMRLFASKGLLAPLDDFIKKDQKIIDEYYADLDPNLIEWNRKYASPDGKTYYLPGEFNTMCMWVHEKLFKDAGVELPGEGDNWTWDDFYSAGKKIKDKSGAYLYAPAGQYFVGIMPWLLTNGASSFDEKWEKATINSPQAVEAAEFCRKLVVDKLAPTPGGTFDEATAMKQGKLASIGRGRWGIVDLKAVEALDLVKIRKWPVKKGNGSPVGWNGYPILKGSKNKEAAWEFVKFLISKEGSSFFAKLGGTIVPARKSVADSPAFVDGAPEGTKLLYDALSYATPIPAPNKGAEIQKEIEETWTQILIGSTPAVSGLNELNEKLQGLL